MIDTTDKLRVHLKIMKKQLLAKGCGKYELYPLFCVYLDENKDRYSLPKLQILDLACEILVEED